MLLSMVPMVLLADVKQFDPFPLVPDAPFAYPGTRHCLHAVHTHAQSESRMLGQIVVCACVNVCGLPTCFARILVVRAQLFSAKASHLCLNLMLTRCTVIILPGSYDQREAGTMWQPDPHPYAASEVWPPMTAVDVSMYPWLPPVLSLCRALS